MNCEHKNVKFGPDYALLYGSNKTQVCVDCGCWRTVAHVYFYPTSDWENTDVNAECEKSVQEAERV